jgi:hypothetical protein
MLPGFRFLFAAITLTMSILVFGLGAAALLRAAHEEFTSIPSWRAAPETMFAAPSEAAPPVLAMLHIEPAAAEQRTPDNTSAAAAPIEATESAAIVSNPAEQETPLARKPEDSSLPQTPRSEIPVAESANPDAATPAQGDWPAPTDHATIGDTRLAANEAILSSPSESVAAPEQTSPPISPDIAPTKPDTALTGLAATKIATLGGPPVAIEASPAAKASPPKPDKNAIKKRLQAKEAIQRRKVARRARLVQQTPQQPADPFAQPATQPVASAHKR